MDQYFYEMKQKDLFNIVVTENDARSISEKDLYNKVRFLILLLLLF